MDELTYKDVGTYCIHCRASYEDCISWSGYAFLVISPYEKATVSFEQEKYEKEYGDKDPEFKVEFSGLAPGENLQLNKDFFISRKAGEDAGTYNIVFGWADNKNYSTAPLETTLEIKPATDLKLVADHFSKKDIEDDPKFSAHMEGLKFEDKLEPGDYGISVQDTNNPTEKALVPYLTDTGKAKFSKNYNVNNIAVSNTLAIYNTDGKEYKEPEIYSESYFGTYDGQEHSIFVFVVEPHDCLVEYSTDGFFYSFFPPMFKNATNGPQTIFYKVTPKNPDYITTYGHETVNIIKANATIAANASYKTEGMADPELSAEIFDLIDGETFEAGKEYKLERQAGEAPGVYEISCRLGNDDKLNNYDITCVGSKFFILAAGAINPDPGFDPQNPQDIGGGSTASTSDNISTFYIFAILAILMLGSVVLISDKLKEKFYMHF